MIEFPIKGRCKVGGMELSKLYLGNYTRRQIKQAAGQPKCALLPVTGSSIC